MSDDEDWDKDFDIQAPVVPKLALPTRDNVNDSPLNQRTPPPNIADLLQKDEDDEDWTKDFVDEAEEAKPLKIIGMKAEPTNTENWDEFFVLPQNHEKGLSTLSDRKTFTLNRIGSLVSNIDRLDFFLKDVIQLFSESKKAKEHEEESWDDELEQETSTKDKKSVNTKVEESKAVFELGMSDSGQDNHLDAIKHFQAAHALLHGVPADERDTNFEIELHYQTGLASKNTSQMLEATNHFKQAADSLSSIRKLTDAQKLIKFRANKELGMCYDASSNFSLACQSYGESIKAVMTLASQEPYTAEIGKICLQLGKCCQQLSGAVVDLSRDFLKKALEFAEKGADNDTKAAANEALTKLKSSNASGEEERSTSSGATEFDLDSEDWDKEFGVDTDRQKLSLETMGSALQKNTSVTEQNPQGGAELPKRLRFLDNLKNDVEIIKFPKATFFFSGIKTKDGHRFLNEDALESWLQTLASKHRADIFQVKVAEMNYKNELEIKQKFVSKLQSSAKYSVDWMKIQYEYMMTLFALKKVELLWDTLFNAFVDLKDANIAKLKAQDQEVFMHLTMQMVYIACKMWSNENDHSFKDVLKSVMAIQPKTKELISIVEVETIIHHKYNQLDDKGFIAQLQKLAAVYNAINSRSPGPHPNVTDYSKQSYSEFDDLSLKVRALCDLHFIMNNLSPLTTHQQNVSYDENDYPDSARKNSTNSGSVESMNFNGSELLDPSVRMTILNGLYPALPVCYLKAKAAFALAHHNLFEMENYIVAEQLLFESLYIMDILEAPVPGVFSVISELGTNALLRYAEVLLKNYKYVYAAASYESAIVNYKLRKRTGYDALLKKIATVTKENDDNKRAIEYFREVLEMYYKEGKSNEIRYVSEMISSLYFEIGDFRKAEAFLSNALATVPQPVSSTDQPKIDPITFKLQMKLSDIYLDSYHYEKGIEVLQYMIRAVLPHGSRPQVLEKLAKAYIKKRWFVEATTILDHLKIDLAGSQFSPSSSSGSIPSTEYGTSPSHNEGGFVTASSMNNNNNASNLNAKLIKYWELSSINYYNAGLFPQAIYCIDMAISSCPTTSLSSLARYFRIRGKIFQLLSNPTAAVQFPTTLQPTEKELFPPKSNHPHRVYTCVGDFIQECVSNYNKAYTYFKAIGDDVRIAKTTASIAQTYLEHLFFPVAVLGLPYNELARLPSFEVSEIAKASSLKEKRGKGGSSGRTKGVLAHVRSVDKDFFISPEKIENPTRCALDIAADTFNPILLAKSYLNMAELRYLQNETEIAVAFWSECKELLFQLFITTDNVALGPNSTSTSHHYCGLLGKGSPPQTIRKVYKLFKRLVRFLFCMDAEFINKNTVVIDVFLGLEYELDHSQKRPTPGLVHAAADQQHAKVMEFEHSNSDSELKTEKSGSLGKSSSKHKPSTLPSLNSSILNTLNLTPQNTGAVGSGNSFISGAMGLKPASTATRKSVASIFANELEFEDVEKFSSKENLVAKTLEINEESAERIWGFLYSIQVQTTNYTKGKVSSEELLSRIKKTTRKILQVKRFNDAIKQTLLEITTSPVNSPNPKANLRRIPSMSAITFPKEQSTQELMRTTKALSKLMFAIQIDDHVVYYVPSNGGKRYQKIGGKDEYNTNQMNTFWYLTIHLMPAPEEYVMLVVNPNLSLDKLLKHLCNKAYWEHDDGKKKSSFFGSFGKTTSPQVNKLKYVDRSKGFHGAFLELLATLESESSPDKGNLSDFKGKVWSSAELSRISFAKKVVGQDSVASFVPLTVSTHTTVSQCFTIPETQEASAENPLALYMYLSSQTRNLTTLDIQRENVNRTLYITKEMVNYFTSLVASQTTYEPEQSKKVVNDLIDNIVACVEDIIPYSNDKNSPLFLVCSKVLHMFPWELMFRETLARHFSMQDVVVFLKKVCEDFFGLTVAQRAPKPNPQDDEAIIPKYYGCYYSGGDKHLMPVEEKRKDWILKEYFQRLKLRQKVPSNLHGLGFLPPLHCALVKYGKKISAYKRSYKYMTWFDMAPVFTPEDLARTVDSITLAHYSIFVLSYADLLEANESVMYLMRTHPTCTFLFIPGTKMKLAVTKLMKVQEEAFSTKGKIKTQQTPAQFLTAAIAALQTENSSPIAIINPVL